jgi:hypothetical protein
LTAATLALLEAAVDRYGREAVTDPVALEGALRAVTVAPPEPQIAALVDAAASAAVPRLRAALEQGAEPAAALEQAAGDPTARWAVAVTAAALGLLPRAVALEFPPPAEGTPTVDVPPPTADDLDADTAAATSSPYRRRNLVLGGLGVVVLVLGVVAGVALAGPDAPAPVAPPSPRVDASAAAAPAPTGQPTEQPTGQPTEQPTVPADPRAAFRDPGLLALAEPFLAAEPGALCRPGEPQVNLQESVSCAFPSGHAALFSKLLSIDIMRDLRASFLEGPYAESDSIRSLRWKYVAGRPGVRTGIAPERADAGEGIRVRYVDEEGVPRLYFDQDSCACAGFIALVEPTGDDRADLDALRAYWADPAR